MQNMEEIGEEIESIVLCKKVEEIDKLMDIQRQCATDSYMIGMFNGMSLCKSILTGEKPRYLFFNDEGKLVEDEVKLKEDNKE